MLDQIRVGWLIRRACVSSCGHYWGLSGLLLAPPLYGPWNGAQAVAGSVRSNDNYIYACVAIWAVCRPLPAVYFNRGEQDN